ncbi:MAG: EAL domain-containing protein [Pseudomonadota bacterium]
MDISDVVRDIGAYTKEAIMVAQADPSDGAVMTIRWVNPACLRLLGHSEEALLGRTARVLLNPDSNPQTLADIIEMLMSWQSFSSDIYLNRADGTGFWAQISFQPLVQEGAAYRYWVCILIDISARKQLEQKLTDFALVGRKTRDLVAVHDRNRMVTWVNDSFLKFTGYTRDEIYDRRLRDVLLADTADMSVVDALVARLDKSLSAHAEILCRRKSGERFLASFEYQPVFDEAGMLEKYVSLIRDITERRSLELRYKEIFDGTNAAISLSARGAYLMVNKTFARGLGRAPEDFEGRRLSEVVPSAQNAKVDEVESRVRRTGQPHDWEQLVRLPGGAKAHLLTKTFEIFDPVRNERLMCSVATDISEIRETERELRRTQAAAEAAERRLWGALDAVPDGFVLYDRDGRIVMFNKAFRDMHAEMGPDLAEGMSYDDYLRIGLEAGVWDTEGRDPEAWLDQRLKGADDPAAGVYLALRSGRWVLSKEARLPNGERAGVMVDVTEAKRTEVALRAAHDETERAQARLISAFDALDAYFAIFDPQDRLVFENDVDAATNTTLAAVGGAGHSIEDLVERAVADGRFPDAAGQTDAFIRKRLAAFHKSDGAFVTPLQDGRVVRIIDRKTPGGDTISMRIDVSDEVARQEELKRYAQELEASKREVEDRNAELIRAKQEHEHSSKHDALTDLANRRYLDAELKRRIKRAEKRGEELAVLHFDLDRFKQINDAHGHDAGDHVLRHVADVLRRETRRGDFPARVGGDEFVVLSRPGRDLEALGRFAARLIEAFGKPLRYDGVELRYGASVGIAVAPADMAAEDREKLLIHADIALYRAKREGRGRWAFFSEELQAEVRAAKDLSDAILRGLDRGEFTTRYQPQFCARTRELAGVEALLRWDHPERGLLEPAQFMAMARDLNVVHRLDALVMKRAMADDTRWAATGNRVPRLSVNVSGQRLRDPGLVEDILDGEIDPARLSIEVLESVFMDDEDEVLAWNIDQLREMGVDIELDDFGTGHSSIVGLIKLKPRRLKIDRHFVEQTLGKGEDHALIRSIINIGRSLDVEVVAEGVETEEQGDLLAELGCDVLQGFAYAPPMDAVEIGRMLTDGAPLRRRTKT